MNLKDSLFFSKLQFSNITKEALKMTNADRHQSTTSTFQIPTQTSKTANQKKLYKLIKSQTVFDCKKIRKNLKPKRKIIKAF